MKELDKLIIKKFSSKFIKSDMIELKIFGLNQKKYLSYVKIIYENNKFSENIIINK